MRNKLLFLLSLLVVAAMVLTACGGGQPTQAPAAPAAPAVEEAAPTEAPAAEAAPTEAPAEEAAAPTEAPAEEAAADSGVSLTIWADELRASILSDLGEQFFAQTGVRLVVVQKAIGDIRADFITAAPTGSGPDIILGAHDWIGELNASGLLAPVELGPNVANFAPNAVQAFTFTDGNIYGMPQATENIALIYNTDLVPTPPATFDELKSMSADLMANGNRFGFLRQVGDPYHYYPIQTAFGGYIFGQNADGSYNADDLGLNSEGSVAALEWLNSMYEEGLLDRGANITGDLMLSAFQNGDAAMIISGPWALEGIRAAGVPYAVANIPTGTQPGAPFMGVQGFMVNAFSQNLLLAQTFLQTFVATDATMQAFFDNDPRISAWLPVAQTIEDPDLRAFAEAGTVAQPMPNIPQMNAVWGGQGDAITLVETGRLTPQEGADQAQTQVSNAIAGR
jgi:maltose-binding protein MalE